jgi:hypothetical protein
MLKWLLQIEEVFTDILVLGIYSYEKNLSADAYVVFIGFNTPSCILPKLVMGAR